MKHYLLVPDSFKGSMSSTQICAVMEQAIHRVDPAAAVTAIPVADGGEGSAEAFLLAMGGEKRNCRVSDPYFTPMEATYARLADGCTAVVEMAVCAGLPLVEDRKDPERTTTYGVGELIRCALDDGCKKIILCLGGSCTNDGGAGMAAALGVRFFRADGEIFIPTGGTLGAIDRIDVSGLDPRICHTEIVAMCDIDSPLYGTQGAACVFAPQKGADEAMVQRLDAGLRHLSQKAEEALGEDLSAVPGSGAAGGLGFGAVAFLHAALQMGIDTVLDVTGFEERVKTADFVFTGEGKIDAQSLRGKVVIGVARRAKKAGVPVFAIVGDIADGAEAAYDEGVTGIFSINRLAIPWEQAKMRSPEDLRRTVENLVRVLQQIG